MFEGMTFHHIGVAVFDIDSTASLYEAGGYHRSKVVFDPIQNVNICWLTRFNSPTIELLSPVDDHSPINQTLGKVGVSPYHFCYAVEDVDQAIIKLRRQRYVLISKPVPAVAIRGSRVAFLFNKHVGLIELVEQPAIIIEE